MKVLFTIDRGINDNLLKLIDSLFIELLNSQTLIKATLDDIGTIASGGTPLKKIPQYWNGSIPWLSPKDLSENPQIFTSNGSNYITELGLTKSSAKLLPSHTILFSSRAPIGYISVANNSIATNQGFKSIIPNKGYSYQFVYELLKHETSALIAEANGSTFKEISGKGMKKHIVNVPSIENIQQFNKETEPIFRKIQQLEKENKILSRLKIELLNKFF